MSGREGNYLPCHSCGVPAGKSCKPGCADLPRQVATDDLVNHPKHYTSGEKCPKCGRVVECIDVIERMTLCVGNAVKYCWRAGLKGDPVKTRIEDLKKAMCTWQGK